MPKTEKIMTAKTEKELDKAFKSTQTFLKKVGLKMVLKAPDPKKLGPLMKGNTPADFVLVSDASLKLKVSVNVGNASNVLGLYDFSKDMLKMKEKEAEQHADALVHANLLDKKDVAAFIKAHAKEMMKK